MNNKFKRFFSVWIDLVVLGVINYYLIKIFGFTREFDFLMPWLYFPLCMFLFQSTFGKLLLRLKYVHNDSITLRGAVLRYKYYILVSLIEYLLNSLFDVNLLLVGVLFIFDSFFFLKTGKFYHERKSFIVVASASAPSERPK